VKEIRADGPLARFTIFPEKGKAISEEVLSLTRKRGWKVEEVSIEGGHLDEVFREITLKGGKRS